MKKLTFTLAFVFALLSPANGQSFSSGSTGADGALNLAPGSHVMQLPESGILNYTTVNIPSGSTLSFNRNFRNTPVILLAQGAVTIGGNIDISGSNRTPGPGGFFGGAGISGSSGFGPGAGQPQVSGISCFGADYPASMVGKWIGSLSLVPILGGSGGAATAGDDGGGGGGAIVIASSTSISILNNAIIWANGSPGNQGNGCGPAGSGGAIRLVANSISVSGFLRALGKTGHSATNGVNGIIRIEAPAGSLSFTGSSDPSPILSTAINPQIISDTNTPSLTIASIGGFPVSYTAGRPDVIDLMLPTQVTEPINVVVQARNIPLSTPVSLNISGPSSGTFTPGTLSGTPASSSTTIAVSGLSRTGATYLIAFADFTLPGNAAKLNQKGPDEIAKVRVIAKPGADSRLVFLRKNGTEIELAKVPKAIQQQFGMN